ncbi:MAG: YkgJ family cysteine cluster protein, partial [Nitrospirota bacterium]|nr:YkgJ family cysteine cluster protein [Nitrospirota bacterium]
MDMARRHDRLTLLPQASLPQCVPSRACFSCDVCCRFPEADSFLRPYFTAEEIRGAVAHGLDPARFPDPGGSQIHLVPNPSGEGYLCPAFDPVTSHCRIYDHRPLDCQIYPLALMWSADRREALLGWDTKCPFLRDSSQGLDAHAERIAALLEGDEMAATLARNPRLIGRFQDDVVVLRSLPKLTERIRSRFEVPGSGFAAGPPRNPRPVSRTLHPLTLDDRPRFEAAL